MRLYLPILFASALWAQTPNPVQWTVTAVAAKAEAGAPIRMKLVAAIEPGWHLYSVTSPVTATATKITAPFEVSRTLQQRVEAKFDAVAGATTESYETAAVFYVDGVLKEAVKDLAVVIRSSACNDRLCLPPKKRTFPVELTLAAPDTTVPEGFAEAKAAVPTAAAAVAAPKTVSAKDDLSSFLLLAFGLGLAAVFTPCVFPMIPFTLSYFIGQGDKKGSLSQAIVFCLGIVVLFTGMGVILSAALGPFAVVQLSANPWVNLTISAVFFAFALSMLGAFEIMLPSGLLTKLNQASEGGGYLGALLMGLTFSLTSFAWYKRFSDGEFVYGKALSQVAALSVVRMSEASIVPFEFTRAAATITQYWTEVEKLAVDRKVTLLNLRPNLERLAAAAKQFEVDYAEAKGGAREVYLTERALLLPEGLPGRPWYKGSVSAPGQYTGYGAKTIAGVRESLELHQVAQALEQAKKFALVLDRYAAAILTAGQVWI